jgi:hypothetical protein
LHRTGYAVPAAGGGQPPEGLDFVKTLTVTVLALACLGVGARASEPQYGRWAVDAQHCSGDTKAGPLVVTASSVTLASETCTFGKMYKANLGLFIEGRCSNGTRHPISLQMKGERMLVTWGAEQAREMQRCR